MIRRGEEEGSYCRCGRFYNPSGTPHAQCPTCAAMEYPLTGPRPDPQWATHEEFIQRLNDFRPGWGDEMLRLEAEVDEQRKVV